MKNEIEPKVWTLAKYLADQVHGSGVDSDWKLMKEKSFAVIKNSFHCMDEHGYYDGWQDFSIKLPLNGDVMHFKLVFNGDQYLAQKNMLRDYLEQLFAERISLWLEDYDQRVMVTAYNRSGRHWISICLDPGLQIQTLLRNQSPQPGYRIIRLEIRYPDGN